MKLNVMSDLHLEFGGMDHTPIGDVLVLAGDIHVGTRAYGWIEQACKQYNAVIMVFGNHEFYNHHYNLVIEEWKAIEQNILNFFVLHNEVVVLGDIKFVGTTLWTHGNQYGLNDFNCIMFGGGMFTPKHAQQLHHEAVLFLEDELAKPFNGKVVVVTHHAPIPECVVPKYANDSINCMFHANLNTLIEDNDIDFWFHGHMHDSIYVDYHGTQIICNPRGYYGHGANHGFDQNFIVEV